eukprot:46833_4
MRAVPASIIPSIRTGKKVSIIRIYIYRAAQALPHYHSYRPYSVHGHRQAKASDMRRMARDIASSDFVAEAQDIGGDLVDLAGDIAGAAADGAVRTFDETVDIFTSPEVQNMIQDFGGGIEQGYAVSAEELAQAMRALAGFAATGCASCGVLGALGEDMLKLEIFRDAYQCLGLFFADMMRWDYGGTVAVVKNRFGRIANVIALDFMEVFDSPGFVTVTIIVALIMAVCMASSIFGVVKHFLDNPPDRLRLGHESWSWKQARKTGDDGDLTCCKSAKKFDSEDVEGVKFFLLFGTTAFMPVSRAALEMIWCGDAIAKKLSVTSDVLGDLLYSKDDETCSGTATGIGIFLLVSFTIPFPLTLFEIVDRTKPRGSMDNPDVTYDVDGKEVPFDAKLYKERVENDPEQLANPFRSLYQGFERGHAEYKVVQMVFKFLLILPCVFLADQDQAVWQAVVVLCIVLLWALLSCDGPFINDSHDTMEQCGRMTAVASVVCTLLLAILNDKDDDELASQVGPGSTLASNSSTGNASQVASGGSNSSSTHPSDNDSDANTILGTVLNVTMAVNAFVMVSFILAELKPVELFLKNTSGSFTFKDSVLNTVSSKGEQIVHGWDLELETKHRVWHSFWDNILLNKCGEDVAERMLELKDATRDHGFDKIKNHWEGEKDEARSQRRISCREQWEGVDLYWDGVSDSTRDNGHTPVLRPPQPTTTRAGAEYTQLDTSEEFGEQRAGMSLDASVEVATTDGARASFRHGLIHTGTKKLAQTHTDHTIILDDNLGSVSCFGKMWVNPYPFEMYIVYDDDDSVAPVWDCEEVQQFLQLQDSPDVTDMRNVRQKFRALSLNGGTFELPFSEKVSEAVKFKELPGEDKMKTVEFMVHYKRGRIKVVDNEDDGTPFQAGFNLTMEYHDGEGTAKYSYGEPPDEVQLVHHVKDREATKGPEWVGLNIADPNRRGFASNARTEEVFKASRELWEPSLHQLLEKHSTYRQGLIEKHQQEKAVLSDGFWYYIYNQPKIERSQLERYLTGNETNATLKKLPEEHAAGLDYLYSRMQFVRSHPGLKLWFVFWDDWWHQNRDMKAVKAAVEMEADDAKQTKNLCFNPAKGNSIAYKPMVRKELEEWLGSKGLLGTCTKRLFSPKLLDALYARMDVEQQKLAGQPYDQAALVNDPEAGVHRPDGEERAISQPNQPRPSTAHGIGCAVEKTPTGIYFGSSSVTQLAEYEQGAKTALDLILAQRKAFSYLQVNLNLKNSSCRRSRVMLSSGIGDVSNVNCGGVEDVSWLAASMVFTRDWVEVFDFRYFVPCSNLSHRGKVRRQLRQTVRQDRFEIFVCEFRKWQSQRDYPLNSTEADIDLQVRVFRKLSKVSKPYCQHVDYRLGSYRCSCNMRQLKLLVALCEEFLNCRYCAQYRTLPIMAQVQKNHTG